MKFGIFRKSSLFCLANIISRRVSIYAYRKSDKANIVGQAFKLAEKIVG